MNIKNYFSSRKFKYGSVAVTFSVIFVAVVLILNIVLTFIGREHSLYADLTKEEFYTVSNASKDQLKDIKEPVEIVFFQKKDDIGEPGTSSLGYVKYLAEEYAKTFDFVSVKYVDMPSSPALANSYKSSTNDTIKTTSVVITSPTTGKKKIVQAQGFFTNNSDGTVYGFNGEKRITSCIIQVANTNKYKALFTTGHNEYLSGTLAQLLSDEGYDVATIDLSTADIPADTDLVIINQPSKDFAGLTTGVGTSDASVANEIEKIKNYIQRDFGNVILTLPAVRADGMGTTPDLPELRALMEDNFGITYAPASVLGDTTANSIDTEGLMLVARPSGEEKSYEYQMHKTVTEKGIKIIAPYCLPLKILGHPEKFTAPVLVSSDTTIMQSSEANTSAEYPASPLVAISSKIAYDENQNEKRGTLLVAGSLIFVFTGNDSYGNKDFFYGVLKSFGNTSVSLDIPAKPFKDNYLDITRKDANAATLVITALLPVVLLVFGMIVWVRRKRK